MKRIVIQDELKQKLPNFNIGAVLFEAEIAENDDLDQEVEEVENMIKQQYTSLNMVLMNDEIDAARSGYKTLKKDPSRYRLAVESLFRRIVKGNRLYRVNNIVDVGNLLSLKTSKSIAVLDAQKIEGDILIRIGGVEDYEGIGRGKLNVENIPLYCDTVGPFGSPTSDTERTMITPTTKQVLVFIISFTGTKNLNEDIKMCIELYKKHANASVFQTYII